MSLKTRILIILIITALASAVISGLVLTSLVQLFGEITFTHGNSTIITVIASALCLIGGLLIIGLLDILLNKSVVVPELEKKMLENERTMLSDQLHQSQKMEAVGRLAGSIAHDFNNLLTIIDGYACLIVADPQGEENEQHAKEVVEAARKASFITRKLLGFSQKDSSGQVLLDLNSSLEDTNKMISRLIGEKITLITKPYADPVYVQADPVQLGQVLMNLAVNARDAMPNGGRITIKIDCRDLKGNECGKPDRLADAPYVVISVRDTGHGMDTETLGQIFEAFFTTKDSDKGTGLGLSIVKGIMKESNGFIEVQSKIGDGTTFLIYLPRADYKDEEQIEEAAQPEDPVVSGDGPQVKEEGSNDATTILLVEDDPMIRNLVRQILEQKNFKVLLAEDGWEGIKVARKYMGKIDLLFTDVVMPGLGGAELAVAMRELYPEIEVLYTSGYSRAQLVDEGVPEDAAVLEKPFTPDKAVVMVRRLLEVDSPD